jgi:DNA-binding transcriptional MocR family regulator
MRIIEQSNLIVVEDDIFSDFEYSPAPRLAALDNLSRSEKISSSTTIKFDCSISFNN